MMQCTPGGPRHTCTITPVTDMGAVVHYSSTVCQANPATRCFVSLAYIVSPPPPAWQNPTNLKEARELAALVASAARTAAQVRASICV